MPDLLTIDQAAGRAGVSASTLKREIAAARLPVVKIRRCLRISPADLDEYLKARKCQSVSTAADGGLGSSMLGSGLAALLRIGKTLSRGSAKSSSATSIVSLAERRNTPARKP